MFALLLALSADASSLVATLEVGPEGTTVVATRTSSQRVKPSTDGSILVQTATGEVLSRASLPDPRIRTVILPDGGGATAVLDRGRIDLWLPWPEGSDRFVIDGVVHRPDQPAPSPPTTPGLTTVQLQDSGPQDARLDLVFLGDGYTQAQIVDFHEDVDWIVDYLLTREPYGEYAHLFNIWRVDVVSAESGVTHVEEEPDIIRDTALGCYYGCAGISRLICCDDDAVLDTVAATVPDAEGVLVLINDQEYGGAGGFNYATAYVGPSEGREVAAHELGHSLVGLWDEYGYGIDGDGEGPNCAGSEDHSWDSWVGTDGVGAFQECSYTGHYRPTENSCMMRTLREDYCPVCREKTVLAMYERLPALITEVVPEPGTPLGDDFASSDVSLTLLSETLNVTWTIDGEVVGAGTAFEGACGGHLGSLLATVTDDTDFVRDDPAGALVQSVGPWPIETKDCTPGPVACGCNATRPTGVFAWLLVGVLMLGRRRRA